MKLPWQRKATESGSDEIEVHLPDDLKTKLDSAASKDEVNALGSKFDQLQESLRSIQLHFSQEADDKRREQARKAAEQQAASQTQSEEELNELFITNPIEAVKRLTQNQAAPANKALLEVRADNLRRETFEDQEKFPYYTGEIKSEIDKLLAAQDLKARNDPSVIEHAYYSTVGRRHKELSEGKLKSRFASAESVRGATAGKTGEAEAERVAPLDEDGKKAARMLGFDEDKYAKMLHEAGVGMV